MAYFKYQKDEIFYEVHNEGTTQTPLVLLNGIMMSSRSWDVLATQLSKRRPLVLVDFIDQGQSAQAKGRAYDHALQVEIVIALMTKLAYDKYSVAGVSYGAQIALQVALKVPSLIDKLIIFNAAASTSPWLLDIGRSWIKAAQSGDAAHFYLATIPYIYANQFYIAQIDWMNQRRAILHEHFNESFLNAMIRLIESSENYNIKARLSEILHSTLVVGCTDDYLTPPSETRYLAQHLKNSKYIELDNCGHASMYEKPVEFLMLIEGFLAVDATMSIV